MTSSDFWRDLANEFRGIRYGNVLTAFLEFKADKGKLCWRIAGEDDEVFRFEALARRAARGIATAETTDLLSKWLDTLKRERHLSHRQRLSLPHRLRSHWRLPPSFSPLPPSARL